jgi:hypothetical protein
MKRGEVNWNALLIRKMKKSLASQWQPTEDLGCQVLDDLINAISAGMTNLLVTIDDMFPTCITQFRTNDISRYRPPNRVAEGWI